MVLAIRFSIRIFIRISIWFSIRPSNRLFSRFSNRAREWIPATLSESLNGILSALVCSCLLQPVCHNIHRNILAACSDSQLRHRACFQFESFRTILKFIQTRNCLLSDRARMRLLSINNHGIEFKWSNKIKTNRTDFECSSASPVNRVGLRTGTEDPAKTASLLAHSV